MNIPKKYLSSSIRTRVGNYIKEAQLKSDTDVKTKERDILNIKNALTALDMCEDKDMVKDYLMLNIW